MGNPGKMEKKGAQSFYHSFLAVLGYMVRLSGGS